MGGRRSVSSAPEDAFDLSGRVAVITGGAGTLGMQHARAIAERGGIPVIADLHEGAAAEKAKEIAAEYGVKAIGVAADITSRPSVDALLTQVVKAHGRVDILINNAANNPKMEKGNTASFSRFENFPLDLWNADVAVGLTGAFLCSQVIGSDMARRKSGVIVNIASDLAVIAPDQRIYRKAGLPDDEQPVKPVTYSVVKTGLIGLTRYLATYWADAGLRVNALSMGGVYNGQPEDFVQRLSGLIPMGRMARVDEYRAAIVFLCSDASSYMTGQNLVIDGGRSCW